MKEKTNIEIVSEITGISIKELNRLNRNEWYHRTTIESARLIQSKGVIYNYNIGNELDFGTGFYLTDTLERASDYMARLPVFSRGGFIKRREWAIIEFKFNPFEILFKEGNKFKYYNFPKHNKEFAEFIFRNRMYNVNNELPHGYDIIWGVMSDNNPDGLIRRYNNEEITYNELLLFLQKPNSMRQLFVGC